MTPFTVRHRIATAWQKAICLTAQNRYQERSCVATVRHRIAIPNPRACTGARTRATCLWRTMPTVMTVPYGNRETEIPAITPPSNPFACAIAPRLPPSKTHQNVENNFARVILSHCLSTRNFFQHARCRVPFPTTTPTFAFVAFLFTQTASGPTSPAFAKRGHCANTTTLVVYRAASQHPPRWWSIGTSPRSCAGDASGNQRNLRHSLFCLSEFLRSRES